MPLKAGFEIMINLSPLTLMGHIRTRPGLYIGNPDEALNRCVFELVSNSIREYLAACGTSITVTIHSDGSISVEDDGGGISIAADFHLNIPFIERVLTRELDPKDHQTLPLSISNFHGIGIKCVNAVSEWIRVVTMQDGVAYGIAFVRGIVTEPLAKIPNLKMNSGTAIRFKPDPEIFQTTEFDHHTLALRLNQLAVLHPGLDLWLVDERPNQANRALVARYHYSNGISEFLNIACPAKMRQHPEPIVINGEINGIKITLGFQFIEDRNTSVLSFTNSSPTCRGGTHVKGLLFGLTEAFNELADNAVRFQPNDLSTGLNAFVAVWLPEPHYGGATKDELINTEVEVAVRELITKRVKQWAAESGEQVERFIKSAAMQLSVSEPGKL